MDLPLAGRPRCGEGRLTRVRRPSPYEAVPSEAGEPDLDLTLGRLRRVRAVHQVELDLQAEVAPDGARGRLLHRVGAAGQLPERRDRPGALDHDRHQRTTGDELDQVFVEALAGVLGI